MKLRPYLSDPFLDLRKNLIDLILRIFIGAAIGAIPQDF